MLNTLFRSELNYLPTKEYLTAEAGKYCKFKSEEIQSSVLQILCQSTEDRLDMAQEERTDLCAKSVGREAGVVTVGEQSGEMSESVVRTVLADLEETSKVTTGDREEVAQPVCESGSLRGQRIVIGS